METVEQILTDEQLDAALLLKYTINKQKENKMNEFVLTDDVRSYHLRNAPKYIKIK